MAKKKGGKADADKNDDEADNDVVDPNAPGLPGYIAVGLLASLFVGWSALRDALFGYGPLDEAMTRFVVVVLACVAGASFIGRMLDRAPAHDQDAADDEAFRSVMGQLRGGELTEATRSEPAPNAGPARPGPDGDSEATGASGVNEA